MQALATIVRAIAALNRAIGLTLSWLSLAVVLVCFTVVVQRYFLHQTQLWMQDLYVWLAGAMFTGFAGYALLRDDHVRVDILYRPWPIRKKAIADLVGVVFFLAPFIGVVGTFGWTFVMRSWRGASIRPYAAQRWRRSRLPCCGSACVSSAASPVTSRTSCERGVRAGARRGRVEVLSARSSTR